MKNNKSIVITIGVLLVLLAVVVALVLTRSSDEGLLNENENTENVSDTGGDELNSIIVNDQIPGDVIFYNSVTLEEPGFVVVRTEEGGQPGSIIGVRALEAGAGQTGNVELSESTVEGGRYYIELYTDTDGNGIFEEGVDTPLTTGSGNNIRLRINTTEDLPEVKG